MEQSNNRGSNNDKAMKSSFDAALDQSKKKEEDKSKGKVKAKVGQILSGKKGESLTSQQEKVEDEKRASVLREIIQGYTKETPEPKGEKEAPIEVLGEKETVDVAGSYVQASIADTSAELAATEPDSPGELEAAASLAFYEALESKLQNDPKVDDLLLEDAANEALESLQIAPESPNLNETELNSKELQALSAAIENMSEEDVDAELLENAETIQADVDDPEVEKSSNNEETVSQTNGRQGDVATPTIPPNTINALNQTPPPPGQNGSPSGGGGTGGVGLAFPGNLNMPGGFNLNQMPNHNAVINQVTIEQHNRHRGRDILLGGVVGYLIGRRRGRIKTEQRLLPVQKKLEKQVKGLHEQIAAQELRVRAAVARKREILSIPIAKQRERKDQIASLRQKANQVEASKTTQKDKAPDVRQTKSAERRFAEKPIERTEKSHKIHEKLLTPKSVERLTLPLLLAIAADIKLGETSLKSMYENGAVDQRNLRLVLKKYLEGERLDKIWPEALQQELTRQEHQRELNINKQEDNPVASIYLAEEAEYAVTTARKVTSTDTLPINDSATTPIQNSLVIQAILDSQSKVEQKEQSLSGIVLIIGFIFIVALFFLIFR